MKVFLSPLRVEKISGELWRVLEPFTAEILPESVDELLQKRGENTVELVVVPAGYETDFASVPRLPLAYLVFSHHGHAAAVLHDWLYSEGRRPRAWCDRVFRAAMRAEGVSWWRRGMMWLGVRAFGWLHYPRAGAPA